MKLYKLCLAIYLAYSVGCSVFAQQSNSKIVYPHLTSKTKTITVETTSSIFNPKFTDFSDGVAWVQNDVTKKWGVIDTIGNILIDFTLPIGNIEDVPAFQQGVCPLSIPGKGYIIINKSGKIVVRLPETRKLSPFIDGIATGFLSVKNPKKSTPLQPVYDIKAVFLNMKGQVIWTHLATSIQPFDQLKPMRPFNNGLAAYYDYVKRKWGYINKEGKIMIPAVLEEAKDFSEGLAAVKRDGKWGYINTKGVMSISNIFTKEPENFSSGRAVVYKNQQKNNACYIDTLGKICTTDFYSALSYIEGYAFAIGVLKDVFTPEVTYVFDKNNHILCKLNDFAIQNSDGSPGVIFKDEILYKYVPGFDRDDYKIIDFNGNTLMSGLTGTFNNGLAAFSVDISESNQGERNYIFGFTDREGNVVIQFKKNEF